MFGLFGKKEAKTPEEKLAELQRKKDWVGLAKTYYEMGAAAMDQGDLNRAQLWLHRADTIYSAKDETYDKVGEKIVDDCSDRIGTLEEEPLLYNDIPSEIERRAEELDDTQVRAWGLLSMARLVSLCNRLARLPGCEVLGELEWAVDMMFQSFYALIPQEDYQHLMGVCNALYQLNGDPVYYTGEIAVPGKAPFQVFDLNGMFGVEQEMNAYIDSHLRLLAAMSQGQKDLPAAESGVVGCALLPDYYVRTLGGRPEDSPKVRAELERIWNDFEFLRSAPTLEDVETKIAEYEKLDILA